LNIISKANFGQNEGDKVVVEAAASQLLLPFNMSSKTFHPLLCPFFLSIPFSILTFFPLALFCIYCIRFCAA